MKWSDIIRADIIMGATGPSAQIMSDQITSDKVSLVFCASPCTFWYASVFVLMTLVKVLVTLVKVLVTVGKTIGDSFGSM